MQRRDLLLAEAECRALASAEPARIEYGGKVDQALVVSVRIERNLLRFPAIVLVKGEKAVSD